MNILRQASWKYPRCVIDDINAAMRPVRSYLGADVSVSFQDNRAYLDLVEYMERGEMACLAPKNSRSLDMDSSRDVGSATTEKPLSMVRIWRCEYCGSLQPEERFMSRCGAGRPELVTHALVADDDMRGKASGYLDLASHMLRMTGARP